MQWQQSVRSRQQPKLANENNGFLLVNAEGNHKRRLNGDADFKVHMLKDKAWLAELVRMFSKTCVNPLQGRQEVGLSALLLGLPMKIL
jgi:hypothetical protein